MFKRKLSSSDDLVEEEKTRKLGRDLLRAPRPRGKRTTSEGRQFGGVATLRSRQRKFAPRDEVLAASLSLSPPLLLFLSLVIALTNCFVQTVAANVNTGRRAADWRTDADTRMDERERSRALGEASATASTDR